MLTYAGVVKDKVVVLLDDVDLADGQHVEVRVISPDSGLTGNGRPEQGDPEEKIQRHLFEIGLLSEIKRPSGTEPPGNRRPIKVRGKPLSQMILDERR